MDHEEKYNTARWDAGQVRREGGERVKEFQHMVTSDQIVGRPRTECAVTSILTESATTPVNWYTSVIVQIKQSQKVC